MPSFNFTQDDSETVDFNVGEPFTVSVKGDFGGGTLTVYHTINGTNYAWVGGEGSTFTAAGEVVLEHAGDTEKITVTLSGATSPDLDVSLINRAYGIEQ